MNRKTWKRLSAFLTVSVFFLLPGCTMNTDSPYLKAIQEQIDEDVRISENLDLTFSVTYNGNGYTGGELPVDETEYKEGDWINVSSPGTMVRSGYSFLEWNTKKDGTGESQPAGGSFQMGNENVILYALWKLNGVSINVTGAGTPSFSMFPADFTLKLTGDNTEQTISAVADAGITIASYQWLVNSTARGTGGTLVLNTVLNPEWFNLGVNILTLIIVIDDIPYSESFHFNVEQES